MNEVFAPLAALLQEADFDDIWVVGHASPDGDAIGSAYGLSLLLRKLGKRAQPVLEQRDDSTFDFITESFPRQDFAPRHVITVDVASQQLLGNFRFPVPCDAVIDHHRNSSLEAPVKLCLPDRASCGEIIFELAEALHVAMDESFARCIYTAVATDTGRFCYSNTTSRTFEIAAKLSRMVPEGHFAHINKQVFETSSRKKLELEAYAVEHTRYYHEGRLALLVLTKEEMKALDAKDGDYDGLINVLRRVEGVKVSAFIRPRNNAFKVSLRAEPGFDCSQLCARFGGGGHIGAAGCTVEGEPEQVAEQIAAAVGEKL